MAKEKKEQTADDLAIVEARRRAEQAIERAKRERERSAMGGNKKTRTAPMKTSGMAIPIGLKGADFVADVAGAGSTM